MTETVPLTCASLYEFDDVFRSAIAKWAHDRRCPIALGDYLEERGLMAAAEFVRWCAAKPDQEPTAPMIRMGEDPTPCGPFPTLASDWIWHSVWNGDGIFPSSIPIRFIKSDHLENPREPGYCRKFESPAVAILHALNCCGLA